MELVHEIKNSYCHYRVEYDEHKKLYLFNWGGSIDHPLVISTFEKQMSLLEQHPAQFVWHDMLKLKGTFSKLNSYFQGTVTPSFERHGVRTAANVLSADVFTRFAMNQYLKFIKTKIEIRIFNNMKDAEKWLHERGMPD